LFKKAKIHIELTTLLIPSENDSTEEISQIAKWISKLDKNIPWHVSAFYPMHLMKDVPRTSEETIASAVKIGKDSGINFVYGGNVQNPLLNNTYCPKCNSLLIDRTNYVGEIIGLEIKKDKKAKCKNCGKEIEGVFSN
jgi:pyruvate formate lyase activating enzyme